LPCCEGFRIITRGIPSPAPLYYTVQRVAPRVKKKFQSTGTCTIVCISSYHILRHRNTSRLLHRGALDNNQQYAVSTQIMTQVTPQIPTERKLLEKLVLPLRSRPAAFFSHRNPHPLSMKPGSMSMMLRCALLLSRRQKSGLHPFPAR